MCCSDVGAGSSPHWVVGSPVNHSELHFADPLVGCVVCADWSDVVSEMHEVCTPQPHKACTEAGQCMDVFAQAGGAACGPVSLCGTETAVAVHKMQRHVVVYFCRILHEPDVLVRAGCAQ